jgi:DNA-binding NarL/FixJ family response regulator
LGENVMSSQSRVIRPLAPRRADEGAAENHELDRLGALVEHYADLHGLSQRERAVLSLGARGLHRKGMSTELGCSPGTVNTYWHRILRKLRLSSQAEVLATLLRMALDAPQASTEGCSEVEDKTPAPRRTNQVES